MHTPLERYLLSAPVPGMSLPALVEPSDYDLLVREAELGWEREEGIGALLFTLRINGVLILFANELPLAIGGNYGKRN